MPEKLHRCVNHVMDQGKSEDSAWAICNSSISEIDDIINRNKDALGHKRTIEEIIKGSTEAPMAREQNGHFKTPRASIHEFR